MKRAFIIHGWEGYPEEGWFPWVKRELEKRDFEVEVPVMPDIDGAPEIERRVSYMNELVSRPDENTYFIGHSIGCQTILRYLETLPEGRRVGGSVFVAGFVSLTVMAIRTEEEKRIIKPWFETPINFEKIRAICPRSVAIFTRDDEYVPLENVKTYEEKLGSKIIVLESGGHLGGDSGITELPEVLNAIVEMSGS